MKKVFLLSVFMIWLLTSCRSFLPNTPTQLPPVTPDSLTSISSYVHYTPPEELDIPLEFDYPEYWIFDEDTSYSGFIIIGLLDPRFLTVPTRAPDEPHGTPSDFSRVAIWIQENNPNDSLEVLVEPYRQGHNNPPHTTILNEYQIIVDAYDAIVLEYETIDFESYTSQMFGRTVFFIVDSKLYTINFEIAKHERGSEFEQGYEYFFNSIKITP